jgi:hypothetical protein
MKVYKKKRKKRRREKIVQIRDELCLLMCFEILFLNFISRNDNDFNGDKAAKMRFQKIRFKIQLNV